MNTGASAVGSYVRADEDGLNAGGRDVALVGLVGRGIALSRTPFMHEQEGARLGLRYVYRRLDTDTMRAPAPDFAEILSAAEITGFAGLNVTYPYKREALAHLDSLSASADNVGAVNTIVLRDGRRSGHNTDCWGFAESFRRNMADAPREAVMLLGAGGAGGAVAQALIDCGVKRLFVHDIMEGSAEALVARLNDRVGAGTAEVAPDPARVIDAVDGLVNASPVGMAKLPGAPLPLSLLSDRLWVADIIYFPIETELLRAARERGCRTLSGSGMAVFQAARAFELFTGIKPDPERMKASFDAFVA
ncbi:shikimate dehydrogenase [Breoghania sp.]|uniref:shikimate dehydrogenase n=1 Tax=Breoghania sp. TaxID=2065378 RepID=UPI002AA82167|nr:shikimate dehydrogenase [Breoghania sp.]